MLRRKVGGHDDDNAEEETRSRFFSADAEDRDVTAVGGGAIAGGGKARRCRPCCNLPWIFTSLSFLHWLHM